MVNWSKVCAVSWFITSFISYVITMGVGWALDLQIYTGFVIILVKTGAIISPIPVFAVLGYIILFVMIRTDSDSCRAGCCATSCLLLAGFFEFITGILFIVAGALSGNSRVLAYGVSAGVCGILSGFSCCCSVSALTVRFDVDDCC